MKMYFRATATQFGAGRGRNIHLIHTHTQASLFLQRPWLFCFCC